MHDKTLTKLDDSTPNEKKRAEQEVYSATKGAAKFIKEVGIPEASQVINEAVTVYARKAK